MGIGGESETHHATEQEEERYIAGRKKVERDVSIRRIDLQV